MILKYILTAYLFINLIFAHKVVENLDLEKFMGKWYVISLITNWIEEGATNS